MVDCTVQQFDYSGWCEYEQVQASTCDDGNTAIGMQLFLGNVYACRFDICSNIQAYSEKCGNREYTNIVQVYANIVEIHWEMWQINIQM